MKNRKKTYLIVCSIIIVLAFIIIMKKIFMAEADDIKIYFDIGLGKNELTSGTIELEYDTTITWEETNNHITIENSKGDKIDGNVLSNNDNYKIKVNGKEFANVIINKGPAVIEGKVKYNDNKITEINTLDQSVTIVYESGNEEIINVSNLPYILKEKGEVWIFFKDDSAEVINV